jgi:hypothetical protein
MMLGHLMEWFYSGLGGIRQAEDSKAYEKIIIAPDIVGDIKWAETTFNTVHGEIISSWKTEGNILSFEVKVPFGCMATIVIPQSDPGKITEGKSLLKISGSVKGIHTSGNKTYIDVASGEYSFRSGS